MRSAAALLAAALAAGCIAGQIGCVAGEPSYDEATPGRNGRGEFFRWDTMDDPTVQTLSPLAVGATAYVGHISGGCVESLMPWVAESGCGRIVGRAPGTALLASFDSSDRLIDWVPLEVRVPNGFMVRFAWLASPDFPPPSMLVVPFRGWGEFVLELVEGATPLMGNGTYEAEPSPDGALHVEGYGRYFRVDCLWTGPAQVTVREAGTGASHTLAVDCLDPPRDGG